MKVALNVEYDGTDFNGFQYQPDFCTIQGELEKAIEKFLKSKTHLSFVCTLCKTFRTGLKDLKQNFDPTGIFKNGNMGL